MITLHASAGFSLTGQYIARITGRDPKYTFKRDFIGVKYGKRNESSKADVDEVGLYELCDVEKRGKHQTYILVLEVEGNLTRWNADKEDAMIIAKAMENGKKLEEIVGTNESGYFLVKE